MEKKSTCATRRQVLKGLATAGTLAAVDISPVFAGVTGAPRTALPKGDPLKWVDVMIGTGGHGHCFPGATVPFGQVQLSPDTYNSGWDWCSGYHISDSSIMGFSHTHLSGTGAGGHLDLLVMPGTGPAKIIPGTREDPDSGYRSRFSHSDETATPGYYSVLLKDYNVKAELTTTERAGIHQYTFPASEQAYLIFDLQHCYESRDQDLRHQPVGTPRPTVWSSEMEKTSATSLRGGRITDMFGHGVKRQVYFALEVSKTPIKVVFYNDDKEVDAAGPLSGKNLKCVMYFKTAPNEVIQVKTGISGASVDGAARNLAAEIPGWDFDQVRRTAREKWVKQLSKIAVSSPNEKYLRTFYTALYHLSLGPILFDDVDGTYRGMDVKNHTVPAGTHNYTTFSLWDTFRTAHTTYALIEPERVTDFMNSLIRMAQESPDGMPVWPSNGAEAGSMTGYHSASVISEAIEKGYRGIDIEGAYKAMMQRAMVDDYRGLSYYRKLNYIPADREKESVSKTFEYCYNDWAIAHVAKRLGHDDVAAMLVKRSTNYRNYYDKTTGFMRPRLEDGSWVDSSEGGETVPFNPVFIGHWNKWRDYTESNAWQTTFGVQHDAAGLIALIGGRELFVKKLDELFSIQAPFPANAPLDISGMIGQYAHGNEPSHHIAYLYVYAGAPYKTQAVARKILDTLYSDTPDGLCGNEDVGQMSAWYILSSLGFYPVDPVSGNYILGSPLFDHASVNLGNGRELIIDVKRVNQEDMYIQSFTLNGKTQQRAWFHHSEIANGGKLEFTLGAEPNPHFGRDPKFAPSSLTL